MIRQPFISVFLLMSFWFSFFSFTSFGQELQIPMDADNRVSMISADDAQDLLMFRDVPDFRSAQLFRVNDSVYVLEVEHGSGAAVLRSRTSMNAGEMHAFRKQVSERISKAAPYLLYNHEGRSRLILGITSLSAGFYSWALPVAAGIEDAEAFSLLYMLIGGMGYVVPTLATERTDVTDGMATLGLNGGFHGLVDGFLVFRLLVSETDNIDGRALLGTMAFFSIGELLGGTVIASETEMTGGKAMVISSAGWFGTGIGLSAYAMTEPDKFDQSWAALGLAGTAAGSIAGNALANDQSYTSGDAQVLTVAGTLGAGVPAALLSLGYERGEDLDPAAFFGAAIAGSVGGFWLGHTLTRGKDFSANQGTYISVGTAGGALIGMGFGFLLSPNEDDWKIPIIASAIGSSVAFGILVDQFSESARISAESTGKPTSWNFQISPLGLAAVSGCKGLGDLPVPLAALQYRW